MNVKNFYEIDLITFYIFMQKIFQTKAQVNTED